MWQIYICFQATFRARLRDPSIAFDNNWINHWPASPIAQVKNPQRSPLRLRFLNGTLTKIFCAKSPVIKKPLY